MQTKALFSALISCCILFTACEKDEIIVTPSDQVTSRSYTITDFDILEISDPFKAYIKFSATDQSLRIEAQDNLHDLIQVRQDNEELTIEINDNTTIIDEGMVLNIYLHADFFQSIKAAGTAQIFLEDVWQANMAEIELTGASYLEGSLNANKLSAELTGSSNLDLTGKVDRLDVDATEASNMNQIYFETDELSVDLKGASNVYATVHQKLNVKANGASNVYYKGNGVVENQDLSGGSKIVKVE